jgi:bifunctional DNA-binding transcriptional regulator/antitoxin component of YhaV-PrlF toxin-antitoxin module
MGFITKVQRVDRPTNQSYYIIVPSALAQSFGMDKGEEFEWIIEDKNLLLLKRSDPKKKFTSKKAKLDKDEE